MNPGLATAASALVVALAALQACATSASVACRGEVEKAQRVHERIENELPLRGSDSVTDYVRAFGWHLAERAGVADHASWRFAVVRDRSVNAFSIGDGRIYVTEGAILAAANQDELAGVIAHEMGHQLAGHFCPEARGRASAGAGHGGTGATSQLGTLRQGMDPVKEREADELAARLLSDAGYDPAARSRVISRSRGAPVDGRPSEAGARLRQPSLAARGPSALVRAQEALLQER